MGLQSSSFQGVAQNDAVTGVGTEFFTADSTQVTAKNGARLKQGSSLIHEYQHIRNIQVLAATVDQPIFTVGNGVWRLKSCQSVRRVVGSDGSAVTADIMACASGTAPASGTTCLSAADAINLKSPAADISISHAMATTPPEVGPGGFFALNVGGTLTAVVADITCEFERVR